MAEIPLPESAIGSVHRTDGFVPPPGFARHKDAPISEPPKAELTSSQRTLADAIRRTVLQRFEGTDPYTPRSGGYNTYVDRVGANTRATHFRDGFLAASLEKGLDFGDSEDTSYRLYRVLLGDPDGYQRAVVAFDDFKSGQRLSYIKYCNKDSGVGEKIVDDSVEVERAARDLGLQN